MFYLPSQVGLLNGWSESTVNMNWVLSVVEIVVSSRGSAAL